MRHINFNRVVKAALLFFGTVFSTAAFGQVDVVATAGTPIASYTTLKAAFDAINAGTHQGTIGIGLSGSTTETAPAVLNSSGAGSALYTSILIQPTIDGVTVSGAMASGRGVIELKGADNVTINGDNPNTGGTNRNLTITNTAANTVTYTSVIRVATAATVVLSADNISVLNCILNGSATGRNSAATTSTTGSENTTFGIYAGGNGGATAIDAPTAIGSVTTNTAPSGTTVNNFVVTNNAINAAARGIVFNGAATSVSTGVTITNNLIGDQVTTLTGNAPYTTPTTTVYTKGIWIAGTNAITISGNTLKNVLSYVATAIAAIELNSAIGTGTIAISDNTITGVALNAIAGSSARGISVLNAAGAYTISGNTVNTVQNFCSSATTTNRPNGIFVATSAPSAMISNNTVSKIYDLNTGTFGVTAVWLNGGNNITVQNNFIYDVNQDISGGVAFTAAYGVNGLWIAAGNGHKVYHNTIHLSGALIGTPTTASLTAAFVMNLTSTTGIDVRNNIFSNVMTGGTTSIAHVAIALPSGGTSAMGLILNNNAYYSGTDAARQGIAQVGTTAGTGFYLASNFVAGTTAGATNFRNYSSTLSVAGTNDNASIASTTAAPFVSATNLHLNTGLTPTQLESGGAASVGVTVDIDGQTRPGPAGSVNGGALAPDMGADEIDGVPLTPPVVTLNSVTPPTTAQCAATARLVSVNVANTSGTVTAVNLVYTVNGAVQAPIAMTNTSGTTWEATIPVPTPANAVIVWGVSATNSFALTGTYSGTTYNDEPAFGAAATITASSSTVCSGNPTTLTASVTKPGTSVTVGNGLLTTGATEELTAFCNRRITYRQQTVYTAADLTAAGLVAGPISGIGYTIISIGNAANTTNFTVKIGNTALSTLTDYVSSASFTTCRPAATYNHAVGLNMIPFSTPFIWDGTSNIIVEVSHGGVDLTNNAETVYTTTAGNTVAFGFNGAATGTLSNKRFNTTFVGTATAPISSISWSDGVSTVGTSNPLVANPTTTTTYTATVMTSGCAVTPSPTSTITVNPLPTAPTATNSAQCGTQVPTASVTSTSGLSTPTFKWYDAASAGTLLQTSTSTTYTSNVSTTTTFYVSELNTVTGCESARTPVTVTVAAADGISASTSDATICVGGSFTLTAANTNPTPNQSYSYTWSGAANSGAATPVAGSPAVITPTAAGTYTYTVNAVDGLCNAVATVNVTVDPFTSVVTPINVSCNGINNGSFAQGAVTCGTAASYSVNGGSFGPIPTNLTAGTYSIVTMNTLGFTSAPQNITIGTNVAPTISIAGTATTVCPGSPVTLTASSSNDPNYTYTWDNGLGSGAIVMGTPSVTTTYTVTGTDMSGGPNNDCIATATFTVSMNPVPTGVTASASDNSICNGQAVTLTSGPSSTPVPLMTQNFDGGLGTWTTTYSGTAPATTAWIVQNSPYTIDGTMDFTNFVTPQGGKFAMSNSDLGSSGLRTRAALISPSFSTVGMTSASLTFENLYQRFASGDSAVAVQVSTNGGTTWTNLKEYFALGVNQGTVTNNAQVMVNESITLGAGLMGQPDVKLRFYYVSSWGFYWLVDNIQLIGTPAPLTYAWTSSPAGYTSSSQNPAAPVSPSVTTTYTMTATNSFGCSASASTTVTVNQPSTSSLSATACGSYTWAENGTTYNTSGTYTTVLAGANAAGCDSTITLNLTINQPSTSSVTEVACSSYTWAENGTTYNTSGTYSVVLAGANAVGCDSTITLNLTINQPTTSTVTEVACSSYTWAENGTTYNTSGSYSVTLPGANANGCDSTITLNLTINQPSTSSVTEVACGSYTWAENGTTYNTSGAYTVVLAGANAAGCDSTITLNLTINQPSTSTVTEVACSSYTWAENGTTYTTSGSYSVTIAGGAANGCDSTITLNLTINQPASSTVTESACESYTWAENGTTYTTSGSYTVTIAGGAANGCDSTITLVLTITGNPTATATDNGDATITASAGTAYQWINCATNTAIAGATSQTYTATANGDYAVVVTVAGGCSDTSDCVNIDYIGLTEITDASIQVFPNPTNNDVTITMTAAQATVEVTDAQGKLLQAVTVGSGEKVNLSTYETGVYFLRIRTVNGSTLERVVKQ